MGASGDVERVGDGDIVADSAPVGASDAFSGAESADVGSDGVEAAGGVSDAPAVVLSRSLAVTCRILAGSLMVRVGFVRWISGRTASAGRARLRG